MPNQMVAETEKARNAAPTGTVEESALSTKVSSTTELAPTSAVAAAQHEIQSAIIIARRFPRNEDEAFRKLMRTCERTSFAGDASYSFPRGGNEISGPSVNLAREAARVWGNIRYGLEVVRDDDDSRQIRGWAWDLETNTKVSAEDEFAKLIQRKVKGKGGTKETIWVVPDERDLRELTNRRGAILVRNCLLQLLPKDLIEDAEIAAEQTLKAEAKQDPDAARKRLIVSFSRLNVTVEDLTGYLGHDLSKATPDEVAQLRQIFKSISDGNSSWREYVERAANGVREPAAKPAETPKPAAPAPDGSPHERVAGPWDSVPEEAWEDVRQSWHEKGVIAARQKGKLLDVAAGMGWSADQVKASVEARLGVELDGVPHGAAFDKLIAIFGSFHPVE